MDIQYIQENSLVLNRYISSYVTKCENQSTKEIWESINNNKTLQGKLKSFALKSFKSRELGAIECADKLLGHELFRKSRIISYLSKLFEIVNKCRIYSNFGTCFNTRMVTYKNIFLEMTIQV